MMKFLRRCICTLILALALRAAAGAGSAVVRMDHITFPALIDGKTYTLEAMVYRPDDGGAHPLVVMNHGRNGKLPPANPDEVRGYSRLNMALAGRGFVSVMLVRRGYGNSQGPDVELQETAVLSGLEAVKDIKAAVEYLRGRPYILPDKIAIAGHSQGGWAAIAAASVRMDGVLGTVNICGGTNYDAMGYGMVTPAVCEHWIDACGEFGGSAVIPSLWIYPENDLAFPPADIRRMHRVCQDAGGRARLAIKPPYGANGHYIVAEPELFMGDIMEFFAEIGLTE